MKRRSAGEGSVYQRASDGMWVATIDLGYSLDGKRQRRPVYSKDKATVIRKLYELRAKIEAQGDVVRSGMTVEAWLRYWLDEIAAERVRPKTLVSHRSDVERYIIPAIGRHRLDRLQPQHVRGLAKAITDRGLSSTSALRCYRVLSKALSDAEREQPPLLTRNPAALVDAPRRAPKTRGALTLEQALIVLRHVQDDTLGSLWAAALLSGARRGELIGLERDRVGTRLDLSWQLQRLDPEHGCGKRAEDKTWPCGKKQAARCPEARLDLPADFECRHLERYYYLTRPKTSGSWRIVPLVDPLASILERHMDATPPGRHGLVWTSDTGGPLDPNWTSKAWKSMLPPEMHDVPLHGARHTTATLLLEAGVDRKVIGEILGHTSVLTTLDYQHVDDRLAREAFGRLSGRLALDG